MPQPDLKTPWARRSLVERARAYFRVRFFSSFAILLVMLAIACVFPTQGILIAIVCVGLDLLVLLYQQFMTLRDKPFFSTWLSLIVAATVSAIGMIMAHGAMNLSLGILIILILAASLVLLSRKAAYLMAAVAAILYVGMIFADFDKSALPNTPFVYQTLVNVFADMLLGLLLLLITMLLGGEAAESFGQWSADLENELQRKSAQLKDTLQSEQRASASLRLLSNINQLIVREHHPKRLLEQVCRLLVQGGYTYAWVGKLPGKSETLEILAKAGAPLESPSIDLRHSRCVMDVIHSRHCVSIPTTGAGEEICQDCSLLSALPSRAALALPIQHEACVFGALAVARPSQDFDTVEIALLQELVDDLAYALENIETERQRRSLAEDAGALLAASSETEFWSAVLAAVRAVLRADRAAIYTYDSATDLLACSYSAGLSQEFIEGINRRFRKVPGSRHLQGGGPVPVDDVDSAPMVGWLRSLFQREGIQSYVVFPLLSANKIMGAFAAYRNILFPFTQPDLELGQTLAHLVSVSLQNARLFAETRTKAAEQAALYAAAQDMAASLLNSSALLAAFASHLVTVLNATSGYIGSFNLASETISILAEHWSEYAAPAERKSDLGRVYSVKEHPNLFQIMQSANCVTIHADDPGITGAERGEYLDYGVQSKLFVPLFSQGQLVGHAEIWESRRRREFSQDEIHLAQTMASYAAHVIHTTNLFKEVEQHEAYFRALIENSAEGIAILERDGRFRYFTPAVTRILGYQAEELIGILAFDLIHPEDLERVSQAFITGLKTPGIVMRLEYRFRAFNGSWQHLEAVAQNSLEDPSVKGIIVNYHDITERKQADIALQQSEEKFRNVVARSVDGIILTDEQGVIVEWNSGYEAITGLSRNEAIGRPLWEIQASLAPVEKRAPDLVERIKNMLGDFFATGKAPWLNQARDNFIQRPDGALRITQSVIFCIPTKKGFMAGSVIRDVTQQRDAEAQIQQYAEELAQAYDSTLEGWARVLELRDRDTEGHTRRVTELAARLARTMNVSENQIIHIRRGAILHDIGKMAIPDSILHKTETLTSDEREIIRQHPRHAYEMLHPIKYLRPALDIPYCHHEKWDGSGYPRGLEGEEIPLAARIFAVVDVWDALTSDRPYRSAWDRQEAIAYITGQSGKYFDPQVVNVFLSIIAGEEE